MSFPASTVWASGETGLMSLAVDPRYELEPSLLHLPGRPDLGRRARREGAGLAAEHGGDRGDPGPAPCSPGFPPPRGRHGGCRLLIASNGSLMVGTGDAATGTNPQDLTSLGGKTLRLNRTTGAPWPTTRSSRPATPTRATCSPTGTATSRDWRSGPTEHCGRSSTEPTATTRSTCSAGGGDYGWNPVPGYNESMPMTDHSLHGTQTERAVELGIPHGRDLGRRLGPRRQVGRLRGHAGGRRTQGRARDVHALRHRRARYVGMRTPAALTQVRPVALDQPAAQRRPDGHHVQRRAVATPCSGSRPVG